jgi:hypothetical protein
LESLTVLTKPHHHHHPSPPLEEGERGGRKNSRAAFCVVDLVNDAHTLFAKGIETFVAAKDLEQRIVGYFCKVQTIACCVKEPEATIALDEPDM